MGHEVLGLEDAVNDLELVLAGVAAHVHVLDTVVEDVRALAEEVIDVAGDCLLVPGDGGGGEDDGIALGNGDVAVGAVRHAGEGARGLALATGGDDGQTRPGASSSSRPRPRWCPRAH